MTVKQIIIIVIIIIKPRHQSRDATQTYIDIVLSEQLLFVRLLTIIGMFVIASYSFEKERSLSLCIVDEINNHSMMTVYSDADSQSIIVSVLRSDLIIDHGYYTAISSPIRSPLNIAINLLLINQPFIFQRADEVSIHLLKHRLHLNLKTQHQKPNHYIHSLIFKKFTTCHLLANIGIHTRGPGH